MRRKVWLPSPWPEIPTLRPIAKKNVEMRLRSTVPLVLTWNATEGGLRPKLFALLHLATTTSIPRQRTGLIRELVLRRIVTGMLLDEDATGT